MPKGNRYDTEHLRNISVYQRQIDEIFKAADEEAARIVKASKAEYDPDRPFSFDDYPSVKRRVDRATAELSSQVERTIVNGIKAQWELSNRKNDDLVETVTGLKADNFPSDQKKRYFGTNESARDAFIKREREGMNLSEEVWRFRRETEFGIDLSLKSFQEKIEKGMAEGVSASEMSRELRDYLKHPDKLFRRVRDERGNLVLSRNARLFHPGRGVYRSSYMNARRLAATETNMAYRSADHERWKSLDFVVGIEIQTSNNHTTKDSKGDTVELRDICDTLAGRYPKDFKFVGWHPHCRCIATTILKTEEEMAADTERILNGEEPLPPSSSKNYEGDLPKKFTKWLERNEQRIANAKSLPYFLADNQGLINGTNATAPSGTTATTTASTTPTPTANAGSVKKTVQEIADERHANRTEEKELELKRYWQDKVMKFTPEQLKNFDELEKALGVKRGLMMTDKEADMQDANPYYSKYKGYTINCQTCVPTYMLRKWGFNVTATANTESKINVNNYIAHGRSDKLWLNNDGTSITTNKAADWMNTHNYKQMTPDRYRMFYSENTKEQGVYCAIVWWKNGGGHATILQRNQDGSLVRVEPQFCNGDLYRDLDDMTRLIRTTPTAASYNCIFRIDDKLFNIKGKSDKKRSFSKLFTPAKEK